MSDPFLDDEASEQDSRPRELYDLGMAGTTYHVTSADHDLVYNASVYTAEPIMRGSQHLVQVHGGGSNVLTISMRVDHPAVRRWLKMGLPPQQATITAYTLQMRSGLAERIWSGKIVSIDFDTDGVAKLNVASLLGEPIRIRLPAFRASKTCNHILYRAGCNVDPNDARFKLTTTALYVAGRVVRYDQGNTNAAGWAKYGALVQDSTGESETIGSHGYVSLPSSVVEVEMQNPIPGLKVGDSITVYAGCDHSIDQCVARFGNNINFGGMPALPPRNPFFRGYGIAENKS